MHINTTFNIMLKLVMPNYGRAWHCGDYKKVGLCHFKLRALLPGLFPLCSSLATLANEIHGCILIHSHTYFVGLIHSCNGPCISILAQWSLQLASMQFLLIPVFNVYLLNSINKIFCTYIRIQVGQSILAQIWNQWYTSVMLSH